MTPFAYWLGWSLTALIFAGLLVWGVLYLGGKLDVILRLLK
jgi:hypothetical protein